MTGVRGPIRYLIPLGLLLAVACATDDPAAPPTTGSEITTTSTTEPTTTETRTTETTLPAPDLINPLAGTLSGVLVGQGPVDPIIDTLAASYGQPQTDTGWAPNECHGPQPLRSLIWDSLVVYFEETDTGQTLLGYQLKDGDATEAIELPDGIELGMPYSEAAALYPDGAYHHDSLELDGVVLQETPMLIVIAPTSADGSAPISEAWVGIVPTCH